MEKEKVVFWLGCHALRHGDIIKTSVAILEKIGCEVETVGGARYCCGTIKDMNLRVEGKMGQGSIQRMNEIGAETVISYCPSCQEHLEHFVSETIQPEFDYGHFITFLNAHSDAIAREIVNPIKRKIALHTHIGFQQIAPINQIAVGLLRLIPGLDVVEHQHTVPGVHCTAAMVSLPGMQEVLIDVISVLKQESDIDDFVTLFHSCHKTLSEFSGMQGVRVINFIKLLGYALGINCEDDIYREWRMAGLEGADAVRSVIGAKRIGVIGEENFERLVLPELTKPAAKDEFGNQKPGVRPRFVGQE